MNNLTIEQQATNFATCWLDATFKEYIKNNWMGLFKCAWHMKLETAQKAMELIRGDLYDRCKSTSTQKEGRVRRDS